MEPDPRFPDRPTHPDFAKLSAVICAQDARSEQAGFDLLADLATVVDPESLRYLAQQRVDRLAVALGEWTPTTRAALSSVFMDGFMTGARYQKEK